MKEIFVQLSAYNIWANDLLLKTILNLSEEEQQKELPGSFSTLQKTFLHMWDAESIWWQRMKLQERFSIPSEQLKEGMKEITEGLLQQNNQWHTWIVNAQDHVLTHEFIYSNSKKEKFKQPIFQMLIHLFNHGTYHRGQIVNLLRQLGIDKIPATDFVVWSRRK